MQCPVCKNNSLEETIIPSNLKAFSCSVCNGNWVRFDDYDFCNKSLVQSPANIESKENYAPIYDSKQAKFCPDCGHILIRYQIHKDIDFSVDHCGTCNGVWLDKNEWESLIANNLHHLMNNFFTSPWQNKLRDELAKERFEKLYIDQFGSQDYEKLKELRAWLYDNKNNRQMIAYLLDEDPYKIS